MRPQRPLDLISETNVDSLDDLSEDDGHGIATGW